MKFDTASRFSDLTSAGAAAAPASRKAWTTPKVITGKMARAQIGIDSFPDDADVDTIDNNYS